MAIVKNQLIRGSTLAPGDRGLWFNVNDNNNRVAEVRFYNSRATPWTLTVVIEDTGERFPYTVDTTTTVGRRYEAGDENTQPPCLFVTIPKSVQLRVNSQGDLRGIGIEP